MAPNLGGNQDFPAAVFTVERQQQPKPNEPAKVHWVNVFLLGLIQFVGGCTFSLLSPFYTEEATQRGLSVTQSGLVYGSVFITTILSSPFFGKYIDKIGSRSMFLGGAFLAGSTNVLFGCLQWVTGTNAFFGLSLAIRFVSALGESAFFSSIYPLVMREAPTKFRATMLSVMETLHGFGLMIGPFVGGLLYEINGFYFPFVICGGLLCVGALLSFFFLKNHDKQTEASAAGNSRPTKYWHLLKMPSITICCFLLILAETSVSWYLPTLQPMLESKFSLGPMAVGAMFMVEGGTYALFSPFWGYILDKKSGPIGPLLLGSLGVIFGYALIGPVPFLDELIPNNIYVVAVGLFIQGSCVASTFITTLTLMMSESVAQGASDTEQTRAMITSLWFISENIAGYMGSALGGLTYDNLGFAESTTVVIAMQLLALLATFLLFFVLRKRKQPETQSLLLNLKAKDGNANYQSFIA